MTLPWPINPLSILSLEELTRTTVVLHIACGRGKQVLRDKNRRHLCTLIQLLEHELDNRGAAKPRPPYRA